MSTNNNVNNNKIEEHNREIALLKYKLEDTIDKLDKYQDKIKDELKELKDKQVENEKEIEKLTSQSTYLKGFMKAIVIFGALVGFVFSALDKILPYFK